MQQKEQVGGGAQQLIRADAKGGRELASFPLQSAAFRDVLYVFGTDRADA
jgi:hypothetical protein